MKRNQSEFENEESNLKGENEIKAKKQCLLNEIKANYSHHPSDGLSSDIGGFIKEFKELNSFLFKDFAIVWCKKNFFELIYGRMKMKVAKDFITCLFHYLVDLLQSDERLTQTCAMYLLYGFYGKLPSKSDVQIRVTLAQWHSILQLIEFYRANDHQNGLYIFHWLSSSGAFLFCCTRQPNMPLVPTHTNLNNIESVVFESNTMTADSNISENVYLGDIVTPGQQQTAVIKSLEKINDIYVEYFDTKKPLQNLAKKSMGILGENCFEDLIEGYKELTQKENCFEDLIEGYKELTQKEVSSLVPIRENLEASTSERKSNDI